VQDENRSFSTIDLSPLTPWSQLPLSTSLPALFRSKRRFRSPASSKPEFTALLPYLFSADFALIRHLVNRDEPFGFVTVEFGRKGALGVGSRLGGLGLVPVG
jgi:hypothetical protein